jgi:hypothetical protein
MPSGPAYRVDQDADYLARLAREGVETWYHGKRIYAWLRAHRLQFLNRLAGRLAPRAFSRFDTQAGPTPGDAVHTNLSTHRGAASALAVLDAGRVPARKDLSCLLVILHEHTHCMVRFIFGTEKPSNADLRRYSHPDTARAAIRHAVGPDCRLGLNAFTGLLRHRNVPTEAWSEGLTWFRGQAATLEATA